VQSADPSVHASFAVANANLPITHQSVVGEWETEACRLFLFQR